MEVRTKFLNATGVEKTLRRAVGPTCRRPVPGRGVRGWNRYGL